MRESPPRTKTLTTKRTPWPAPASTRQTSTSTMPAEPRPAGPSSTRPSPRPTGPAISSSSPASTGSDAQCSTSCPSAQPSESVVWDCVSLSRASTPRQRKGGRCSGCSPSWPNSNENSSPPTPATASRPRAPEDEPEEDARSSPPSGPPRPTALRRRHPHRPTHRRPATSPSLHDLRTPQQGKHRATTRRKHPQPRVTALARAPAARRDAPSTRHWGQFHTKISKPSRRHY